MPPLFLRACGFVALLLLAAGFATAAPPDPAGRMAATGRYPLFVLSPERTHANRVDYGMRGRGEIGPDNSLQATNPSLTGAWPRATANQYIFNSGVQVAGIIGGTRSVNPWAGDTTFGQFFDPSGLRQHGSGVTALSNAAIPSHLLDWPQAGYLPYGAEGILFADALSGRPSAGDADVWWLSWEADPGLNAGRPHPLGIVAEHRVMGWNAPRGNEDILYLVITFYNITARDPAAYANYRPGLRELLAEQAEQFHQLNEAEFAIDLPDVGYTIDPFHAGLAVDQDITNNAGTNLASVNWPLAMSFAWHADFPRAAGWTFPADIFSPPFAARSGLIGTSMLHNLVAAPQLGFHTSTSNGGPVPDVNSAERALRYLSGDVDDDPAVACNTGVPSVTRICFVPTAPYDARTLQASPPIALVPAGAATMVVAYVHAAPVAIPGAPLGTRVFAGDPTRLTRAGDLVSGANLIDSIAGFTGFVDDNGNGQVEGRELRAVPRSLIAKAQLAQAFFEHRFLAPAAPESPEFFLIPGDNSVTVTWRPSQTDQVGDPYFTVASQATMTPSGGGAPVPNPLYDPNYRQFDVEGYRIWRGRTDAPGALELVARFDHVGTVFRDYTGQVKSGSAPHNRCAPELAVVTDCAAAFDTPAPGVMLTKFVDIELTGTIRQVAIGDRVLLPNGEVELLTVDTLRLDPVDPGLGYSNNGVPYVWRDSTVRNGLTYFYAVTAFDVNAINSTGAGRTSLESPRVTRRVVPRAAASNVTAGFAARTFLRGRGVELTDTVLPVIDPVTGRFDKRFPVADGAELGEIAPVAELFAGAVEAVIRLDSITVLGVTTGFNATTATRRHFTVRRNDGRESRISIDLSVRHTTASTFIDQVLQDVLVADPGRVARYRGLEPPSFPVSLSLQASGLYYSAMQGRGCVNGATGFGFGRTCFYNGPRWFDGANESRPHPTGANTGVFSTQITPTRFDNAGELDGVRTIYHPQPYDMVPGTWRDVHHVMGVFAAGADYRVHWGAGGVIDSVIDLTHNVPVPFAPAIGASWGVLNADAVPPGSGYDQRASLGYTDMACVEPLHTLFAPPVEQRCSGPSVALERMVRPGPLAMSGGMGYGSERTAPLAQGNGFGLYLKGRYFLVELEQGVPAAGGAWTLRDYVGAIDGGSGVGGNFGLYLYTRESYWAAPLTAVGVELVARLEGAEEVRPATKADLARVHTVPDPYYQRGDAGAADLQDGITFVHLPTPATIRIYSSSGVLVRVLSHASETGSGAATWDLRNRANRSVASGVYFYHVATESGATTVGRLAVVR